MRPIKCIQDGELMEVYTIFSYDIIFSNLFQSFDEDSLDKVQFRASKKLKMPTGWKLESVWQ